MELIKHQLTLLSNYDDFTVLYFVSFHMNNTHVFKVGITRDINSRLSSLSAEYKVNSNIEVHSLFKVKASKIEKIVIDYLTLKYPDLKFDFEIGGIIKRECFYFSQVLVSEIDEIRSMLLLEPYTKDDFNCQMSFNDTLNKQPMIHKDLDLFRYKSNKCIL